MLSDFELIQHKVHGNADVRIYPISDVHLGAAEHMTRKWEEFCQNVLKDPRGYIILGGDLINNATRNSVSNIFEETMRPREQKQLMVSMLEPIKSRILCAVTGNHERRSTKDADDDPTYDIMCKLDLEHLYRENVAFVKIQVGEEVTERGHRTNGFQRPTYVFAVTHGSGGGILTGGAVNRNERYGYVLDGCDALVVGHTHKPFVTQPSKIYIDARNNTVSIRPFKVISSTSWLQYGGYAAQKMLLPSSHAPQVITLHGKHKQIDVTM